MEQKKWNTWIAEYKDSMHLGKTDLATKLLGKMRSHAKKTKNGEYEIEYLYCQAYFNQQQKKYEDAEKNLQTGIQHAQKHSLHQWHIQGLIRLNQLYIWMQQNTNRLSVLEEAVTLAETYGYEEEYHKLLIEVANLYFVSGLLDQAEKSFNRIYKLGEEQNKEFLQMKGLAGLGKIQIRNGELEAALDSLKQAKDFAKINGDIHDICQIKGNLAALQAYQFQYDEAVEQYIAMIPDLKELGYYRELLVALLNAGILSHYIGTYNESMKYYQECEKILNQHFDAALFESLLQAKSHYYYDNGEVEQAFHFINEALTHNEKTGIQANRIDFLLDRGYMFGFTEQWERAKEDFEQVWAFHYAASDNVNLFIQGKMGNLALELHEHNNIEVVEQAAQLLNQQSHPKAKIPASKAAEFFAFTLEKHGYTQESIPFYKQAVELYKTIQFRIGQERVSHALSRIKNG